jgi:hypothetical protein
VLGENLSSLNLVMVMGMRESEAEKDPEILPDAQIQTRVSRVIPNGG